MEFNGIEKIMGTDGFMYVSVYIYIYIFIFIYIKACICVDVHIDRILLVTLWVLLYI